MAEKLCITYGIAKVINMMMVGEIEPDIFFATNDKPKQCLRHQRVLQAINKLMGCWGTEYLMNRKRSATRFEYVNRGETYAKTIMYDLVDKRFIVTSVGDEVEAGRAS